ncbi:MAG: 50S ribosomal protein L9 [Methylococcaceae bacterium]
MDIILLEKVTNLGNLGEKVTVKPGYGRNYLIPQGKAVVATATRLAEFEQRRAELEQKAAEQLAAAEARAATIGAIKIVIRQKAGDEGRLYGSVSAKDIAEAATKAGVAVEKNEIRLPSGPLRTIGDYEIKVQLHGDVMAVLALNLQPE